VFLTVVDTKLHASGCVLPIVNVALLMLSQVRID
jgi:hypothetical protein